MLEMLASCPGRPGLPGLVAATLLAFVVSTLAGPRSASADLLVSQVIISGNKKTSQKRIEQIMGIRAGDKITFESLDRARSELARAKLFENIQVEIGLPTEQAGAVMYEPSKLVQTEVFVFLKEKLSWLGFPFGSASSDNKAIGAVALDQNFLGTTQKILAAGQYGVQTTFGFLSWRNPSLFGSRLGMDIWGIARKDDIPFYRDHFVVQKALTKDFGGALMIGGYWTRDFSTWIGGSYRRVFIEPPIVRPNQEPIFYTVPPSGKANDIQLRLRLTYDNRNVEEEVYSGTLIQLENYVGDRFMLSDFDFLQFKLVVEQYFRYAKRWSTSIRAMAGLSYATGQGGIPVMSEFAIGGTELRGSAFREFRGDTVFKVQLDEMVRLFSFWRITVRGALFYDIGVIYSRHPDGYGDMNVGKVTLNDLHHGIGGGFRFYVRGIALPALSFDVAYGIDVRDVAYYFSVATGGL